MEFNNKTVIITGGCSGIGENLALSFHKEGARVLILDTNEDKGEILEEKHKKIFFYKIDLKNNIQCENIIKDIKRVYENIDILINNAGIENDEALHDISYSNFDHVMKTNLYSMFNISKYVLQVMMKQKKGCIVNLCSVGGILAWPKIPIYNISKGGVLQLTKSLALEYAKYGIRVNCVSPGLIMTPLNEESFQKQEGTFEEVVNRKTKEVPLGILGSPKDISEAILFLASEKKARYITGSNLVIDGGYSIK
ncbi:SDR family NAD(P)-dependent oxidoreductase [Staphylococcus saprophyticus]|uniref:SDR family NAD(P)-dependent oxidoreductase n=1 Tax=Staphylococcus saprophyticus TaxID=29385 RepID=UPI00289EE741|nr:SDR family NAD(P)-dependent oxidoreductase [Staphylococcus saprophyticus]